ncbi:hypothetical protein RJT34_00471 [Clitoria ternatea]|uniref:Stress up-regulated Nod 19 n=1 Tax=Clitoria ternatea TaxID=43366 RepID=A0AAN9KJ90_CLITE
MKFISIVLILSLSSLSLLPRTAYSLYQDPGNPTKADMFLSESFEMGPGSVAVKNLMNIKFPKGHIGVKSFDVELVDEDGNSIPLYETYFHHWFAIRYFVNTTMLANHEPHLDLSKGYIFKRNEGICNSYILPHYWGLGGESRGTSSHIPDPFAVELGNPTETPDGHEEQWLFNIMVIDTRGVQDKRGCAECRCDHFNLSKDFYNVTKDIHGQPLTTNYKGGLFCCQDNLQSKLRKGFQGPTRKVEYMIPTSDGDNTLHVQKAKIPIEKGGYLIYGTAHMHAGAVNATLYGQDGRILCTSTPTYGTGKKAGNEEGYVVAMSVCYPQPGSIKIHDGETLTLESRYKREFQTGAMGHFYIYLADQVPHEGVKT